MYYLLVGRVSKELFCRSALFSPNLGDDFGGRVVDSCSGGSLRYVHTLELDVAAEELTLVVGYRIVFLWHLSDRFCLMLQVMLISLIIVMWNCNIVRDRCY